MELRQLKYFVAVAEECHFGRAAARLHMAQPPLSQQIRRLEHELGVTLLERTTRRVSLTAAGERYLERVRTILAEIDDASTEVVRAANGEVGRVVVGVVGSASYGLLPPLARHLRNQFPDMEFEFTSEMLTPDQFQALTDGEVDVALVRTPFPAGDLQIRALGTEPLMVAVPTGHHLADRPHLKLADLAQETFITYPDEHRSVMHDRIEELCRREGFRPRQGAQVAQTSTMLIFVAAGLGVALIPESAKRLGLEGVQFLPLLDAPHVELAAAWKPGAPPATLRVVDVICEWVATGEAASGEPSTLGAHV